MAPAIISEEEFNYVQQLVQSRRHIHPRQATSRYLFSKVLKCARCGSTLIGKYSQTKRGPKKYVSYNYYCPNRMKSLCDLPMINQNFVENLFIQMIDKWDGSQYVKESIQKETAASNEDIEEKANRLKNELIKIEKRRSKWQYAWADDTMTYKDYQNRMKEEAEKEKMILKELEELAPTESLKIDNHYITTILSDLRRNWNVMDNQTKKQFILIAVNYMVVDKISKGKDMNSIEIKEINLN
jgi:site-specific DNA recombinase